MSEDDQNGNGENCKRKFRELIILLLTIKWQHTNDISTEVLSKTMSVDLLPFLCPFMSYELGTIQQQTHTQVVML
jgi:hypothetical protein